jgi:hypothetical protein
MRDLVGAFARFPHLPKMLNRQAIVDTIVRGCEEGYFVARLMRPDKSVQTWWRHAPPADVLDDPQLELVLPDKAEITSVSSSLLRPGGIDDLWKTPQLTVGATRAFFDGTHAMTVARGGYDEPMPVPRVPAPVVDKAVQAAVKEGAVWFTSGPASLLGEDVPAGLMSADALLQAPPDPISPLELLPGTLADAWRGGKTDALSIAVALSKKAGKALPWITVREALDAALRARLLDRAAGGADWSCDYSRASGVSIAMLQAGAAPAPQAPAGDTRASAEVALKPSQLQDFVDVLPDILKATAGLEMSFRMTVEVKGKERPSDKTVANINTWLESVDQSLRVQ